MSIITTHDGFNVSPEHPLDVQISGGHADEPFRGTGNETKTFAREMSGFVISNDSTTSELAIVIHGQTWPVLPNEVFGETFIPFTQVEIQATGPWRAYGKRGNTNVD